MVKTGAWSARAVPKAVPELRGEVYRFAESAGVPDPPLADLRLAVSEALTNAIVHGYREEDSAGEVQIAATLEGEELRVVVRDSGVGFKPRTDSPGLGLGLPIIHTVADSVEVRAGRPGTELHMCFHVAL